MAGAQPVWVQTLATELASDFQDMLVPWRAVAKFSQTGVGEDGVKVGFSSGGLVMNDATAGTIDDTTGQNYNFSAETLTPAPREVTVAVARHHLRSMQPEQLEDLIEAMKDAYHRKLITLFQAAVDARCTAAAQKVGGAASQDMNDDLFDDAFWKLQANGGGRGGFVSLMNAHGMKRFRRDLKSKNLFASVTQEVIGGVKMMNYGGVLIFPDATLTDDGNGAPDHDYNVMLGARGLRLAYGGTETELRFWGGDSVNVNMSLVTWCAMDIPNPALAMWMQSDAAYNG